MLVILTLPLTMQMIEKHGDKSVPAITSLFIPDIMGMHEGPGEGEGDEEKMILSDKDSAYLMQHARRMGSDDISFEWEHISQKVLDMCAAICDYAAETGWIDYSMKPDGEGESPIIQIWMSRELQKMDDEPAMTMVRCDDPYGDKKGAWIVFDADENPFVQPDEEG